MRSPGTASSSGRGEPSGRPSSSRRACVRSARRRRGWACACPRPRPRWTPARGGAFARDGASRAFGASSRVSPCGQAPSPRSRPGPRLRPAGRRSLRSGLPGRAERRRGVVSRLAGLARERRWSETNVGGGDVGEPGGSPTSGSKKEARGGNMVSPTGASERRAPQRYSPGSLATGCGTSSANGSRVPSAPAVRHRWERKRVITTPSWNSPSCGSGRSPFASAIASSG